MSTYRLLPLTFLLFILPLTSDGQKLKGDALIDSLEAAVPSMPDDSAKVKALHNLESFYYNIDPQKAIRLNRQAIAISRAINHLDGIASSYNNIGELHRRLGNFDTAELVYDSALVMYGDLTTSEKPYLVLTGLIGQANAYNNIGIINIIQGRTEIAVELWLKALPLYEKVGRSEIPYFRKLGKRGEAKSYNNLGINHRNHKRYDRALDFFQKSLTIKKELGAKGDLPSTLGNIGSIHFYQGDYEKSLIQFREALQVSSELSSKKQMAVALNSIGSTYAKMELLDTAMAYYLHALNIKEELGDKLGWTHSLKGIAELNSARGNTEEALKMLDQALDSAMSLSAIDLMRSINQVYYEIHAHHGNYELAYDYHITALELQDSMFNEQKSRDIGKLEAKYEHEKRAEEVERLQKEAEVIENEERARKDNLQYSGILIFLVLLFVSLIGFRRLKLPARLVEGIIFFAFLLFFEFTLVLLDPYIEFYSGGAPAFKLFFNALLAGLIFPLHSFFERYSKRRIIAT